MADLTPALLMFIYWLRKPHHCVEIVTIFDFGKSIKKIGLLIMFIPCDSRRLSAPHME
jgi:hypothetical protein